MHTHFSAFAHWHIHTSAHLHNDKRGPRAGLGANRAILIVVSSALRAGGVRTCLALSLLAVGCTSGPPAPNNTAPDPSTHTWFPIASGPHAATCDVCHGTLPSFKQFTCDGCHDAATCGGQAGRAIGHFEPLDDRLHASVDKYSATSAACYGCHPTGAKVAFDHNRITSGCNTCHAACAPFDATPKNDSKHPALTSDTDCAGCHLSTTDWTMVSGAPGDLRWDPTRSIGPLQALIPTYAGTSITSLTPRAETLAMPMSHASKQVAGAASSSCSNCHASSDFAHGVLHASLAALKLAQPTACADCHAGAVPMAETIPTGFVGPTATHPARTPPSGEMKHDAVAWAAEAPTKQSIVPGECGLCHVSASKSGVTWSTGRAAGTLPVYHASLDAAALAQPTSCVDCHANSRPTGVVMSSSSTIAFDHSTSAALADCAGCHTGGPVAQWTSAWSGGRFHLASDASPATCLPCHAGERPASSMGWMTPGFASAPFDYGANPDGVTHGDGQDCALCHAGPGSGAWGGTQDWQRGHFTHGPATLSGTTCIACHTSQRPTMIVSNFDHGANGQGDCSGCHQPTVQRGSYAVLTDWMGGSPYPGSTLIGTPSQSITETEITLHRSGANQLVTGMTSIVATLYNQMLHDSSAIPAPLNAGPSASPDYTKCWQCHTSANHVVTSYLNGKYHASLDAAGQAQPKTQCNDCHAQMRPAGIVERAGSDLVPMDHAAKFTSPASIGGVTVAGVGDMDCSGCHAQPSTTWSDGVFHGSTIGAVPADCTVCHYPLIADTNVSDRTSGSDYAMHHASSQITFQDCQRCHTGASMNQSRAPAATLWNPGAYHASLTAQPSACAECHAVSAPTLNASTKSTVSYSFAMGGTSSNGPQWMNHGASPVSGKDCAVCHLADAKASGSAWSKSDSFHASTSAPASCADCHGLSNGGGATQGTNNNLPATPTASTMLTTAAKDPTTGVPAGTADLMNHVDVNASAHDCGFCHTQLGVSTSAGVQGREWAQASFHASFSANAPLVMNATSGRCSNCHMNVRPGSGFTLLDHSTFTATQGSEDCSSCHFWPGSGTPTAPNWLGAVAVPQSINVGGFPISQPPATQAMTEPGINNLPHPAVTGATCTSCHQSSTGGKQAIGYDHLSSLINGHCDACHEAGSDLVGTAWNGATTESAGAGDTRPFSLASVTATYHGDSRTITPASAPAGATVSEANHFYPIDCYECHAVPGGTGTTTTGSAYKTAWAFPHTTSRMSNPVTCQTCHGSRIPN